MKILVVGSGGREHALAWKIAQSDKVSKIYCAPGNGGTKDIAENININPNEIDKLLKFALEKKIDLTIVGPEEPLVLGIVDEFKKHNLKIFGPNRKCAQLEGSKDFSKKFMKKYSIPTAKYKSYTDYEKAIGDLENYKFPLVIKADGLCAGKGVIICNFKDEAEVALKDILVNKYFGSEGNKVIIEEFLDGVEASLLCFVTNGKIIPLESAKDYKKIYEKDLGPNTGGVGCFSPNPLFTEELKASIRKNILNKIIVGFNEERLDFNGILFIGLMLVEGEAKVLEFNVRFGDPETEVIVPRLKSDIVDIFLKALDGSLSEEDLIWDDRVSLTVVLSSEGYPSYYKKGHEIIINELGSSIILFHNGTKHEGEKLLTDGGRVLSVTSLGETIDKAKKEVYKNIKKIKFQGAYYRTDIGEIYR
ncbi:phosphoribosylamine--glycine ligase [Clostridium isatidis]|uniref:Phosphoribosylamine--glycine ligase n=1 Tax=Clostridium isatidis TaxID=182773 RepID=A0A343JB32_9CLOT|nr:phosphoribosylamine--glycine ligase [Clostridium isatidis]ASW42740.1 phosphoribosylamine--glycine ligase [Clostridium isatidis]